jgi:hypothetical protein
MSNVEEVERLRASEAWPADRVADVLDDSADYIERYGWHQGSYTPGTAHHVVPGAAYPEQWGPPREMHGQPACVMGAMVLSQQHTTTQPDWYVPQPVIKALQLHVTGLVPLDYWNDARERTQQQVLDALRKAAKLERRQCGET